MVEGIRKSRRLLKTLLVGRKPTAASGTLRLSGAVAAFAIIGSLGGCGQEPVTPAAPAPFWPDQGWTAEVRHAYHHESQGTALPIPASWFLALERPVGAGSGLFSDSEYLDRFGFIASPRDSENPDGLPIGFARTTGTDPRNDNRPIDRIGFTCAACHTGRLEYDGRTILVDGGSALINLGEFRKQLGEAMKKTLVRPVFKRFADRVLGENHTREQGLQLYRALVKVVVKGLIAVLQTPRGPGTVEEGFGRLDALTRIGNQVFGVEMRLPQNIAPITAPVAYPHIWDTAWFDWVQYNASIRQPMVRNAGEAMGVGGLVNYNAGPALFDSTIPIGALHENIEQRLAGHPQPTAERRFTGLRSPVWPQQILGRIDGPLAERGAALYRERCRGCHLPAPNTPEFWEDRYWTEANTAGERYLKLNLIPISTVGTDPAQAEDMRNRTVQVRAALGLPRGAGTGDFRTHGFADALKELAARVADRWYDTQNPPIVGTRRDTYNGNRPNEIRDRLSYKARPLNGIWATPPFLHNGSVRTLWDLLSPYAERNRHCDAARRADRCILLLGVRQFDPAHVGYVNGGSFRLNTARRGNLNTGHLFQNRDSANPVPGIIGPYLPPDDRRALIEYLKTL